MSWRRTLLKAILGLAALGLISGALLALFLMRNSTRPVTLPSPSGPYAVGRTSYDWVDESRRELLTPHETAVEGLGAGSIHPGYAKRELMVWFWYPTTPEPGAKAAAYLPGKWGEALEHDRGLFFRGRLGLWQRFDSIRTHSIPDATVSSAEASYPVLIFSTGYGRVPTDYTVLLEDLASHGFIVVALANTYSAPVVVFPDGRVAERVREAAIPDSAGGAEKAAADKLVMLWAADAIFVMNRLERLNADPDSRFSGRLDLARLGLLGHSLGGATAAEACSRDTRCRAAADIDGWLFGDVPKVGLHTPFMVVLSGPTALPHIVSRLLPGFARESARAQAEAERDIDAVYRGAPAGYKVTLERSRHFNFSDSAVLFSPIMKATGMLGTIDGRRGLATTSNYLLAFFDKYLKNADSPLLDGPSSRYPAVSFESHLQGGNGSPLARPSEGVPVLGEGGRD